LLALPVLPLLVLRGVGEIRFARHHKCGAHRVSALHSLKESADKEVRILEQKVGGDIGTERDPGGANKSSSRLQQLERAAILGRTPGDLGAVTALGMIKTLSTTEG
jgi:hypothetical protein